MSIILSLVLGWKVYQTIDEDGVPLDFTPQSIFLDDGDMVQQLGPLKKIGREDNDFLILLTGDGLTQTTGQQWVETVHKIWKPLTV